jgi:hypothetical protein
VDPRGRTATVDPRTSLALWLRAARAQRNLTLDDVARVTKIQARILEKLETGQLEGLPAEVFVRGFVKSFARCVGLDEGEASERYGACAAVASSPAIPAARAFVETLVAAPPRERAQKQLRETPVAAPVESAPVESAPVEIAPVEIAPVEIAPVEIAPIEAAPIEATKKKRTRKTKATGSTTTPRTRKKKQLAVAVEAAPAIEPPNDIARDARPDLESATAEIEAKASSTELVATHSNDRVATHSNDRVATDSRSELAAAGSSSELAADSSSELVAAGSSSELVAVDSTVDSSADVRASDSTIAHAIEVIDQSAPLPVDELELAVGSEPVSSIESSGDEPTQIWQPTMPPQTTTAAVPWKRPTSRVATFSAPILVIDDADPDLADEEREEREAAAKAPHRVAFLPPILLDRHGEDKSARQGGLTLAVIILLIAATLTLSYLMRHPSASGDGVTQTDVDTQTFVA